MKEIQYQRSGNAVQGSFSYKSHSSLVVGGTENTSGPIKGGKVILSATDYYRIGINAPADNTSMIFGPGMIPLCIPEDATISVLRINAQDSEISLIIPE